DRRRSAHAGGAFDERVPFRLHAGRSHGSSTLHLRECTANFVVPENYQHLPGQERFTIMRMRSIAVGAAALIAATAAAVVPTVTSASASTTFKTATISAEHPDTTGISCSACLQGPGGPIWANDHLKEAVK